MFAGSPVRPSQVRTYQRDGPMTVDCNMAGAPNYFPNSFSGPAVDPTAALHRHGLSGDVARYNTADDDNFTQVRIWGGPSLVGTGQSSSACGVHLHLPHRTELPGPSLSYT